jgi:uroporphyrinogen-III decarboxylase
MTSKERLETTASFREPDRIPIELQTSERARELPELERLVEFIDTEADNFLHVPSIDWGFFGMDSEYSEEVIEDIPGEYQKMRRVHRTNAGVFYAITQHFYPHLDSADYHWERRYIETIEEMERLADAPRTVRPLEIEAYRGAVAALGDRAVPLMSLAHPLGTLVRRSKMEEVYMWFLSDPGIIHRYLDNTNRQMRDTILALAEAGVTGWFGTWALEMLIPPWMGQKQFDELIFPYDKMVSDAIHQTGGRHRSHCHGNCMEYLEQMVDMGIDATEPLEPPPFGDIDLAEAKRRVGDRMMLSGNVASQFFNTMDRDEVRASVRKSIKEGARGGGYSLRTTGGHAGLNPDLDKVQLLKIIENVEAYVEAGLEYGTYPIRL